MSTTRRNSPEIGTFFACIDLLPNPAYHVPGAVIEQTVSHHHVVEKRDGKKIVVLKAGDIRLPPLLALKFLSADVVCASQMLAAFKRRPFEDFRLREMSG